MYYHRTKPVRVGRSTPSERARRNRDDKGRLVRRGASHGILVYAGEEPAGWCQYGPREELPRIDASRRYKALRMGGADQKLWRITCFSVDRRFRGQGVATAALRAALRSIGEKGGGTVEAYPATRRGALAVWFGTVSMFEREGFRVVAPFGRSNVLVRREVRAAGEGPGRSSSRAPRGGATTGEGLAPPL